MRKSTLNQSMKEIGIFEGDVIKLSDTTENYYQFINGEFKPLNRLSPLDSTSILNLIKGGDFEIVARGEDFTVKDLIEYVSEINCTVDSVNDTVDNIDTKIEILSDTVHEYIHKTEYEKSEKERQDRIVGYIFGFGILAMAILSLIAKLI